METESKGTTPVNWRVVLVLCTILVATAATISMIFPFTPWMVRKFKIEGKFVREEDTGYYAGAVASAFFVGQFFGSYFWGVLADKKSRRLTILISGSAVAIFTFMFAFTNTSTGLAWAVVTRVLSGASNGVLGIAKASTSDVSDNTNQAKGLAYVAVAWGVGILVVGPAIGGLLAEPVRQYPAVFSPGFLETFPYFLPSAVSVFLTSIALIIVYFYLPKTLKQRGSSYNVSKAEHVVLYRSKRKDDTESDDEDISDESVSIVERTEVYSTESSSELEVSLSQRSRIWTRFFLMGRRASRSIKSSSWWSILKVKGARLAIAAYCVFSFSAIGFDELASLWMATKPYRGGLGFDEKTIGISLAVISVILYIPQILLVQKTFYLTCAVSVFFVALSPIVPSMENSVLLWAVLVVTFMLTRFCNSIAFVMLAIFINNSVPKYQAGAINGLAMALTALSRAMAPSFGGSMFAWSISWGANHIGFPFDYHLVFYFFSIVYLTALLPSVNLPNSVQKQKCE
ncbi:uncharacterized protein [Oscarella lobularis]|uniref:uncharacterized protein isoform X2 n=1 Tax=Oscarella lobularis TaxID=121494 RepID=UPI003313B22A